MNPSRSSNKSQFTIPEAEVKGLLSSKNTIKSPVTALDSGNFARTLKVDKTVGNLADKFGGAATDILTVITDAQGNLITAFPGGI